MLLPNERNDFLRIIVKTYHNSVYDVRTCDPYWRMNVRRDLAFGETKKSYRVSKEKH